MKVQLRPFLAGFYPVLLGFLLFSCKKKQKNTAEFINGKEVEITHATGFKITEYPDFSIITVTEAFLDSDKDFVYGLVKKGKNLPDSIKTNAVVTIPVRNIVVTSTTHIPSLEMLGVESTLKGFPNLDYISSPKTRQLIDAGNVEELGQNESINTESTINLDPDVVVSFGVEGENKAVSSLERAGIPVVYNGDWVEREPLGKAEWIKFFAAFYDKQQMADSIFNSIATNYKEIRQKVAETAEKPTVLSGAMFKDVWYMPRGNSWAAQLIADAGGDYLYKETTGSGSLSLSLEEVLDKAEKADYWIAPNAFESYSGLENASNAYAEFEAFKQKKIFGYGSKKGATGGLIYYELAPNRPDWVLHDLASIFHPHFSPIINLIFLRRLSLSPKNSRKFLLLGAVLLIAFLANLWLGSVRIPLTQILAALTGQEVSKNAWEYIILNYRLPKALAAIMTGSGLAAAGLMMQTLFKNPLAGPFVLGISSGASLGVAIFILGGSFLGISAGFLAGNWGMVISASLGSFLVLAVVISVAARVNDAMALLIIGLMFGSLTSAIVSILAYFSPASELQRYIFWSFGSLGDISWSGTGILATCYFTGIILSFSVLKNLNSLLLGDLYAQTVGISIKNSRLLIIIATSILAGSLTAFTGPIAFVGLAVPHLVRQFFHSANHWVLMPASLMGGALLLLICDSVAQAPFQSFTLPINAITSLIGAPVVIWLLVRKKKLIF